MQIDGHERAVWRQVGVGITNGLCAVINAYRIDAECCTWRRQGKGATITATPVDAQTNIILRIAAAVMTDTIKLGNLRTNLAIFLTARRQLNTNGGVAYLVLIADGNGETCRCIYGWNVFERGSDCVDACTQTARTDIADIALR